MNIRVMELTFLATALSVSAGLCGYGLGIENLPPPEIKEIHTLEVRLPDSYYIRTYPDPITVDEAIAYLNEARYSHQVIADNGPVPSSAIKVNGLSVQIGGINYHLRWVERYQQIINLLEKKNGQNRCEDLP